jgi:hypothetical protein
MSRLYLPQTAVRQCRHLRHRRHPFHRRQPGSLHPGHRGAEVPDRSTSADAPHPALIRSMEPSTGKPGTLRPLRDSAGAPRADCEVCGQRVFTHLAVKIGRTSPCAAATPFRSTSTTAPSTLPPCARTSGAHRDIQDLRCNDLILRFRRGAHTLTLFADGRAIIHGTTDITVARSLYARFVGA